MSDASQDDSFANVDAIARWSELVGVPVAPYRVPAVAAYLGEILVAIEALNNLDLTDGDFPGSFDPAWNEVDR